MTTERWVPQRWVPPTEDRVSINIHLEARAALHDLLASRIGYSEFIMRCVQAARKAADAHEALDPTDNFING